MIRRDGRLEEHISLQTDRDVALARVATSRAMDTLGARAIRKTRFVTAVSEIARNAILHGGGGEMRVFSHDRPPSISVLFMDDGPGIEDMELAMSDGFTSAGGLGCGLGGAKRLVDEFEINSSAGAGTTIRIAASI